MVETLLCQTSKSTPRTGGTNHLSVPWMPSFANWHVSQEELVPTYSTHLAKHRLFSQIPYLKRQKVMSNFFLVCTHMSQSDSTEFHEENPVSDALPPVPGHRGTELLTLRDGGGPSSQDLEKASSSTWGSTEYFHFIQLIYLHLGVGILQTLRHQSKEGWVGWKCVYSAFISRGKKIRCILVFRKKNQTTNQTALNRHESSSFARTFHRAQHLSVLQELSNPWVMTDLASFSFGWIQPDLPFLALQCF